MAMAILEKTAMVFIDGNNFYHNIKTMKIKPSDIDFYKLTELVCANFSFVRKKTIYYNSVPSIADGKDMYYAHMKFLSSIEKLPKFEVKIRKLQKSSTWEVQEEKKELISTLGLCDKCKPIVESNCLDCIGNVRKREKGIDVMIAVDMLEVAIKNKCDCCIIISGDADFVPVLDLIKSNGKECASAFLTRGYSYELREKHKFMILSRNLIIEKCLK